MNMRTAIWDRIKGSLHKQPPQTRLLEEQVLEIARKHLASNGGALVEPVGVGVIVENNELIWHLCDRAGTKDANYHLHIADATGKVIKEWMTGL